MLSFSTKYKNVRKINVKKLYQCALRSTLVFQNEIDFLVNLSPLPKNARITFKIHNIYEILSQLQFFKDSLDSLRSRKLKSQPNLNSWWFLYELFSGRLKIEINRISLCMHNSSIILLFLRIHLRIFLFYLLKGLYVWFRLFLNAQMPMPDSQQYP